MANKKDDKFTEIKKVVEVFRICSRVNLPLGSRPRVESREEIKVEREVEKEASCNTANVLPLYTGLSDSERQQLTASLQQETSDIQQKFQELVTNTIETLQRHQVPLEKLVQELETSVQKGTFSQATSIQDVFTVATSEGYWSFFDYERLKCIFWLYHGQLDKYDIQFLDYCKRRLCRLSSDGAAAEEKVVMLLDNKMGLQKTDVLKLTQLRIQVSRITTLTVTKLIWPEDCSREPTLRTQHKDEGEDEEDTCAEKQLDTAPTLRLPGEPHPPPQRYFMHSSKDTIMHAH